MKPSNFKQAFISGAGHTAGGLLVSCTVAIAAGAIAGIGSLIADKFSNDGEDGEGSGQEKAKQKAN